MLCEICKQNEIDTTDGLCSECRIKRFEFIIRPVLWYTEVYEWLINY